MNKNSIKKLQAIVGEKYITTAKEDLMCYSYDGTGMEFMPAAVVFPVLQQRYAPSWRLPIRNFFR